MPEHRRRHEHDREQQREQHQRTIGAIELRAEEHDRDAEDRQNERVVKYRAKNPADRSLPSRATLHFGLKRAELVVLLPADHLVLADDLLALADLYRHSPTDAPSSFRRRSGASRSTAIARLTRAA